MKKFSLKTWVEKLQQVSIRFPFTSFCVLGLAFYFFLQINKHPFDAKSQIWAFFSVGIPLTLAMTLLLEDLKNKLLGIGINLLSIILLLVYTFSLPDKFLAVHFYQLIVLGLVFSLSAFFVSFFRKDTDIPFWEFSKTSILQLLISGIFAQVLMLGLSLAVLSLKELFKIDVQKEVYQNLAVICYVIFIPIYFLANVPDKTEKLKLKYTFPKFVKILGLYILLPILILYSLILYVYLVQIVIKWELPNGWVSTLVSILGLGGFLCMLILYPLRLDDKDKNKIVNWFSSYFSLVLIPLLALMSVGIFRRLGDYGLTINRCYVLILNIWLYGISFYILLSKANHLKWIVISFAGVALLSSVGPWSVFSITERKLSSEIGLLLKENKLLKNGKAFDNSKGILKIDSIASKKLSEDIHYIYNNFGTASIQRYFSDSLENLTSWKIQKKLGIQSNDYDYIDRNNVNYFNATISNENHSLNIADFGTFIRIDKGKDEGEVFKDKNVTVLYKQNTITVINQLDKSVRCSIPLRSKLLYIAHFNKKERNFDYKSMTLEGVGYKLIINEVYGFETEKRDSIVVTQLQAELFIK